MPITVQKYKYAYYIKNTLYLWPCDDPHEPSPLSHKQCWSSNNSQDTVGLWDGKENLKKLTNLLLTNLKKETSFSETSFFNFSLSFIWR